MRLSSVSVDPFALPQHGGERGLADARFGRPAAGWLDLSTGINPFAYPVPALDPEIWQRLPDFAEDQQLRQIAAACFGVDNPDLVLAVPGTQSVLQMLPRLRPYAQVAVVGPTYGEYSRCWTNAGHQVMVVESVDRRVDADIVVICSPNNPDGRRHDPERMLDLADWLGSRGGLLVVDEAFVDVTPESSIASQVRPGLLVLRSVGKFYGLAGLRLGFVIAEPQMIRILRQALGPWAVSGPALALGSLMLADNGWAIAMRRRLIQEMAALNGLLTASALSPLGGTALFTLVSASRAWALYEYLGQQGILARPFATSPRWLRFGLPGDQAGRQRLADALSNWR